MPHYLLKLLFSLISLIFFPFNHNFAQQNFSHEIGFRSDNDSYLMIAQDQYYTNGINFYYRKAVDKSKFSDKWKNKIWIVGIGQYIYNASDGIVYYAKQVDRSITGYLFANGKMSWYSKNEEVFSLGTEIAVIGANAFGEEVQRSFHKFFGFYEINGWEYELNKAIGIDALASYSRLIFRNKPEKFDISMNGNLSLGSNNTKLSISPHFRFGKINPLFESISTGSRVQSSYIKPKKEFFFFYRPEINWVVYNSTIQGGLFLKDKGPISFSSKPFYLSQTVGTQLSSGNISLNLNYTFNTKEIKSEATAHQYGSISLAYYF